MKNKSITPQLDKITNIKLSNDNNLSRTILDPIYSYITFNPDILNYIDTIEFQRLRDIKQLGTSCYIFPSATHTRFEHCIGTSFLAKKMFKNITKHQTNLIKHENDEFKEKLLRNITLAGLYHDIGHGPFSHSFENYLLPQIMPNNYNWSHEQMSCDLLEYTIDNNNIDIDKNDINIIKNIILGKKMINGDLSDNNWIFDIVSNKTNSIDVDKFDYLTRDSYHLGLNSSQFDFKNLIKTARIINNDICYPKKFGYKIYDLFQIRYKMFKQIYLNKVTQGVDLMLNNILYHANNLYKFNEIIYDPEKYIMLTDSIINEIYNSQSQNLDKSKKLIKNLKQRNIYRFANEVIIPSNYNIDFSKFTNDKMMQYVISYSNNELTLEDIHITTYIINYGMKNKNPVDFVNFYEKNNYNNSFVINKDLISLLLPTIFSERYIRIYVEQKNKIEIAKIAFYKFCTKELGINEKYFNNVY